MLLPVLALVLLVLAAPASAQPESSCAGDPAKLHRIDLAVHGQPAYGSYAEPALPPQTLAVFAHGYSCNVDGWGPHLRHSGRLSGRRPCRRPLFIRARGARRWRLALPRRFPAGRYRISVVAVDPAGNRSRPLRRRRLLG